MTEGLTLKLMYKEQEQETKRFSVQTGQQSRRWGEQSARRRKQFMADSGPGILRAVDYGNVEAVWLIVIKACDLKTWEFKCYVPGSLQHWCVTTTRKAAQCSIRHPSRGNTSNIKVALYKVETYYN